MGVTLDSAGSYKLLTEVRPLPTQGLNESGMMRSRGLHIYYMAYMYIYTYVYVLNYWLKDWETRSLVSSLIQEIFKQCSRNSCFQRIKLLLQVMHSSKVPSPWFNTEFVTTHTPFSTLNIFHSFHSLLSDTRETTTATGILLPLTYANQKTATLMPAVLRIQNLAALDWEPMRDQHILLNAKVC